MHNDYELRLDVAVEFAHDLQIARLLSCGWYHLPRTLRHGFIIQYFPRPKTVVWSFRQIIPNSERRFKVDHSGVLMTGSVPTPGQRLISLPNLLFMVSASGFRP